ncbi:MAG TPA: glycosyltransferase, partial [Beutenbergiaceae bacterium]|nr:glycosyltransferase [Beutenbergiaceae bacterium]
MHHPDDARIRHRQIETLLEHGWQVTYAAPFRGYGIDPAGQVRPGLRVLNVARSAGRRRLRALRAARRLLKARAHEFDLVLLHDPELLISFMGSGATNVVLDVHEDPAAAIEAKEWIPRLMRGPIFSTVRAFEGWAEKRMPLLLAEYRYQDRFRDTHPVVPNAVRVPAKRPKPGSERVVYLGALTVERGAQEVVEVARALSEIPGADFSVEVIGQAHGQAEQIIRQAHLDGDVVWHGFVPSDRALPMLDGALVGLSLLHDMPNYRHSMPTKILEYMAHGVPVI